MSRFEFYLLFGGALLILQTDFVKGVLQSEAFSNAVLGAIVVLLVFAAMMTFVQDRKRKADRKDDDFPRL